MNKANPLVGLLGQYGSDDESDEEISKSSKFRVDLQANSNHAPTSGPFPAEPLATDGIQPAPVPHCPWSACYDESSGFTYYWNQHTNAVTWDPPPEYLLALKLAQQQLNVTGSAEVSAEEWQLYQQALAEKEKTKKTTPKPPPKAENATVKPFTKYKNGKNNKKRQNSDSEEEKIELITSYYNSDSDSNDEESPTKKPQIPKEPKPATPPPLPKNPTKKQKTKPVEYGPSLPPNQEYTVPIGPALPPNQEYTVPIGPALPPSQNTEPNGIDKLPELTCDAKVEETIAEQKSPSESISSPKPLEAEDDDTLLTKLKNKAKLLEKLGGEIPKELISLIKEEKSEESSPAKEVAKKNGFDMNIDDFLEEIEKKELPKTKNSKTDKEKTEVVEEEKTETPSEDKTLFPSSQNIDDQPKSLFPSAVNIDETETTVQDKPKEIDVSEKKGANIYLLDTEHARSKKKLRISNSVLPERKYSEVPSYTTKYSQSIEGFTSERTGLGFNQSEDDSEAPKKAISYGKGLMFTKGETLNEKDESLEDSIDLLEAKLKFLNQQQPYQVSPVQEMAIQMQTLVAAHRASSLSAPYLVLWLTAARDALQRLEAGAAPPGWTVRFHRSSGRYEYRRDSDGFTQWEFPGAVGADDMDICTTPPHVPEYKPLDPPPPPPPPPAPPAAPRTPPPPAWHDPPPPGCDDVVPETASKTKEPKKEIGDELLSFYNDLAELENSPAVSTANSPERERLEVSTPPLPKVEKEKEPKKKKTKVKISSTVGLKHKTVSSLVAKWQQVAEEIHSD